jgi:hypothetical protein
MELVELFLITNGNSSINKSGASFDSSSNLPIFCYSDVIEKVPISLAFCFIYIFGTVAVVAFGIYIYFRRIMKFKSGANNGHSENQQNSPGEQGDIELLPRVLRSRHSTELPIVSSLLHGLKS